MKKTACSLFALLIAVVFGLYPLSAQDNPDAGAKDETTVDDKKEKATEEKTEIKKEEKTAEEKEADLKKKTSDYTLGEIVVRSKALASVEDAARTTELSAESLKSRSEKTLDQALQTVPGFRVYQGKKGQMNFDMHGFQHSTVAILVDGLPFEEIYDGGGGDISRILVMNASKIVVNRGTSSALYGQRGAFGAVNVISKKPERVFFNGGVEIDQYGGYSVNAAGGGTYKNFYLLLAASTIKSNSYEISKQLGERERVNWFNRLVPWYVYNYTFQNVGINPLILPEYVTDRGRWNHTESTKYYVSGKAGYAITENVEVGISASYYQGSFNFNGFEPSAFSSYAENGLWSNPSASSMFMNRAWQWPKDYRVNVTPYVTLDFGDFNLRAMYYFTRQANILYGWTNQAETAMFDRGKESEHAEQSNGFYVYPSYKFTDWNKLTAVIHYRFDEFTKSKRRISAFAPTGASNAPNYQTPWFKTALMTAKYVTVGLEDEFKFKTNYGDVKFSLGISYDAQKLSRNQGSRYTPLNTTRLMEDVTGWLNSRAPIQETSDIWGTGDSFDPVVAALYEPIKEMLKIRATFSRKVKFPTLHEYSDTGDLVETYFFSTSTQVFVPFVLKLAQIKPETAYNASAGYELTFLEKALTWRQDYFYAFYEDKIVSIGDPNSNVGNKRWTNIDGSEVHGLESTIASTIGTNRLKVLEMNLSLCHVFTSAKDRLGSHAVQGERVKEVPMHQLIMQAKFDFISGTSLNLWSNSMINQIVYVQRIPITSTTVQTPYSSQVYGRKKLHNPFTLNIRVSQRIVDHFDLWVMCKNITDDYNSDPFNPGPGRTWYFGGDAEF